MSEKGVEAIIAKLESQFNGVSPGSKEQETIVRNLTDLMKVKLTEQHDNADFEEMSSKMDAMEAELDLKKKQLEEELELKRKETEAKIISIQEDIDLKKKQARVNAVISAAEPIGNLLILRFLSKRWRETLDFERTGIVTTKAYNALESSLRWLFKRKH